ncbi:hypothetical protein JKF63_07569 [Porcisia hertigi]|uniref:Uncharacterized protein n=1 Tax=Porcisia hertigi TaxID=2761500 RepID=A0A836LM95_9TRYP|nr:hypothetical protein JKF63_07569 [Porcisia hertigi]
MRVRLMPGRRSRMRRLTWRALIALAFFISTLTLFFAVFKSGDTSENAGGHVPRGFISSAQSSKSRVPITGSDDVDGVARASLDNPLELPYTESLEELIQLLRLYAEWRGVRVDHTDLPSFEAAAAAAAAGQGYAGDNSARGAEIRDSDLRMPDLEPLRGLSGDSGHLSTNWVLDDPENITAEQETYVERFIAPV